MAHQLVDSLAVGRVALPREDEVLEVLHAQLDLLNLLRQRSRAGDGGRWTSLVVGSSAKGIP